MADGPRHERPSKAAPSSVVGYHAALVKLAETGGWFDAPPRELCLVGWKVKFEQGMGAWSKVVWFAFDADVTKWVAFSDGASLADALGNGLGAMLAGGLRWQVDRPYAPPG